MELKRPTLTASSESSQTDMDEQIQQAVVDVIRESNTKTVEIKPAPSIGSGKFPLLLVIGGVAAIGYMLKKSTKQPTKRVKEVSKQATETIKQTGKKTAEQVEKQSEKAAEQVEQKSEKAAEQVEQKSEKTAEKAEQATKKSE